MLVLACIFHLGEPLCTMAAHSSTFPEPFDTPFPKRLAYVHRKFCGDRWSDHLTMLNAFMQWEDKHMQGEIAEQSYCEKFSLNLSTLRITHDARNQLRDLLTSAEFPEACLEPHSFYFQGEDSKLDVVVALLCMGFYPNVCFHKEKRKVITTEGKAALIHKSSVNCSNLPPKFPSPFFVFGEKIRTRAVSCKQMTMITPLHLLLFGCKKVECIKGHVCVDRWINFRMLPRDAARIVALHSVIEDFIMEVADNPEMLSDPGPQNCRLIELVRRLCSLQAGKFGSDEDQQEASEANAGFSGGPPRKAMRLSGPTRGISSFRGYSAGGRFTRGSSYGSRGGGFQGRGGGGYGNRGGSYNSSGGGYGGRGGGYGNQGGNYGGRGGGGAGYGNQGSNYGGRGGGYGNQGSNYGGRGGGYGNQGSNYGGRGGGYGNQGGGSYGGRGSGFGNQSNSGFGRGGGNNYGGGSGFNSGNSGSDNYGDQGWN